MFDDEDDRDSELDDLVERYLDGKLDEEQSHEFEGQLLESCDARDALIQALTVRALVELAYRNDDERARPPKLTRACRRMQRLIPHYRANQTTPKQNGILSAHLEECSLCFKQYRRFVEGRGPVSRNRSWVGVAVLCSLVVAGVASAYGLFVDGASGSARFSSASNATVETKAWPAIPWKGSPAELIAVLCGPMSREGDDGLSQLMMEIRQSDPDAISSLTDHSLVALALRDLDLEVDGKAMAPDAFEKVAVLIALLHEPNLTPQERTKALGPLARIVGDRARTLLKEYALEANEDKMLVDVVLAWRSIRFGDDELPMLRELCIKALDLAWTESLSNLLTLLLEANDPSVEQIALDLLSDKRVESWAEPLPSAATIAFMWAERNDDIGLKAKLEALAADGSVARSRLQLCEHLWITTKDPRWLSALVDFASDPNPMNRLRVAQTLQQSAREYADSKEVLERLASDPHAWVSREARLALEWQSER